MEFYRNVQICHYLPELYSRRYKIIFFCFYLVILPYLIISFSVHSQYQLKLLTGKLSISSQSGDGIDRVQSIGGLSFDKYTVKMLQVNTCLYLSKGLAEYVAVLDVDELFIPKGIHSSFFDVLKGVHSTPSLNNFDSVALQKSLAFGVKVNGDAEVHRHPFCFITVNSEVFISHVEVDKEHPWMHERYV